MGHFADITKQAQAGASEHEARLVEATWQGQKAVLKIQARFNISSDINLIKPGVGETTRYCCGAFLGKCSLTTRITPTLSIFLLARNKGVEVLESIQVLPIRAAGKSSQSKGD